MTVRITTFVYIMLLAQGLKAQEVLKLRPSPLAITSVRYKDHYVKVTWGAYNYNPAKDLWRFDVPVQSTDKIYDPFTIIFDHRNEVADLLMMWDNTMVSIPIKFLN